MIVRIAALVALVSVLLGSPAPAFELLRVNRDPCSGSRNLSWPLSGVPVSMGPLQPQAFRDLAEEARQRWNESAGVFRFSLGGGGFCDLNDGVSAMGFSDRDCSESPLGGVLAITTSRWRTSNGELLDADIVFNIARGELQLPAVFRQVAMHELGHVLGLDHSDACGGTGAGTLMRSILVLGEPRLLRPQADDINGANTIYPGGASPAPTGDQNSCNLSGPPRGQPALQFLGIPLLILFHRILLVAKSRAIVDRAAKLL